MPTVGPIIPESRPFMIRLPHWGWSLLATIVLVVGSVNLSVWLPYHREQQLIQKIKSWGGTVESESVGPEWLLEFVGDSRLMEWKVLKRVTWVYLSRTKVTDAEISQLSILTNLRYIDIGETVVTDVAIDELQVVLPKCDIYH